ncbi:protein lifeguard 1-like isoform X5 [Chrysoperla carnea]|uniref:protein lifeguard 1-like isoform X5 n=1 Tax=Chrysoperla carnea TaxID=189513 RepID=UPI001D07DE5B|nr:protein lifeguard 1-like isoform X5 [Chrysoperla carnea]
MSMYGGTSSYDGADAEGMKNFDFDDKTIRAGFIRKVYSILSLQLLISVGFIAFMLYHAPTRTFVQNNPFLLIIAIIALIITIIALACCGEVRRKAPANFILLGVFTVAESFMLGVTCSLYNSEAVLMAVGLTAVICIALTLFAFQTKWDFTVMGGGLFVAVIVLMIVGIIAMFLPKNSVIHLIYAGCGAILFSLYLIYDTQLMMGGKHKYSISPEEYIFGALNLYMDIINIFLFILQIIGNRD